MRAVGASRTPDTADLSQVIRWFIILRWVAVAGVAISLLYVQFVSAFQFPWSVLYVLTALLAVLNGVYHLFYARFFVRGDEVVPRNASKFLHIQISSDYVILFLIIYFTGYVENPLVFYFVFHVLLTFFLFPGSIVYRYVAVLSVVFIAISLLVYFGVLRTYHLNVQAAGPEAYKTMLFIRTFAVCSTLAIAAYLIQSIEKRIVERGRRFELELDRYRTLDRAKSNFILQVTHELRGPLAALKGYHEMMLKGITGEIGDRTEEALRKADRRTRNLLTIIDEMIDLAYMKSEDTIEYPRSEISINSLFKDNVELFAVRAHERGQNLVISCPSECHIQANRDLLNIMLSNLLSNAIKYSDNDTDIVISAEEKDDGLVISVSDHGIGIEPDELEKIFEEFYRCRRAREIERDGTGLGLSIVQRAVDSLEGKLSVYSEVGQGSSFQVYIPK